MRKDDWTYWTTGLPSASEALEDLEALARELGTSKAEANRFLIVAWSKARRGDQLWGMANGAATMGAAPTPFSVLPSTSTGEGHTGSQRTPIPLRDAAATPRALSVQTLQRRKNGTAPGGSGRMRCGYTLSVWPTSTRRRGQSIFLVHAVFLKRKPRVLISGGIEQCI